MRWQSALMGIMLTVAAGPLRADQDTQPYLFSTPSVEATGAWEWDEFSDPYSGPHAPDALAFGTATAQLSADGTFIPEAGGPPFGLVTSTQNLYTGATLGRWTVEMAELPTLHPTTTLVLQVASLEPLDPATFLLGGQPPIEFVEQGLLPGVLHDTDGQQAEFDTFRYWAEWHVDADTQYALEFGAVTPHTSLAGARLDYFHLGSLYDAPPPGAPLLTGDTDGDGDVDSADLNTLILSWTGALDPGTGERGTADGDFDGDQDVDAADMTMVVLHWTGAAASADAPLAVPEPASATLAGGLALLALWQCRRSSQRLRVSAGHNRRSTARGPFDVTWSHPR